MTHETSPPEQLPDPNVAPSPERTYNFNDPVLVKVTPFGEQVWDEYWANARHRLPDYPIGKLERDEEGYVRIQLWELAHIFGPAMGGGELPIETNFKYPETTGW